VQQQVASGDLSMIAAVEIAKMDTKTRATIMPQIERNMSAAKVRKLGKRVAQEAGAKAKPGKAANKQKGAKRDASIVTWQNARAKQQKIAQFSAHLAAATTKEKTSKDYFELRGALGCLLWCRGDLDSPILPSEKKSEHSGSDAKVLKKFQALVKAEAKKYTPPAEDE